MPNILGRLVKITAQKKLMVRVSQKTYDFISIRAHTLAASKFGTDIPYKYPMFKLEDDEGEDNYFCMISLDRYDKQLLERKFEPLLRQDISVVYKLTSYSFIPEGEDAPVEGINVTLTGIRKFTGKEPLFEEKKKPDVAHEIKQLADEVAAAAETRVVKQLVGTTELNAEEQAVDDEVDPQVKAHLRDTYGFPGSPPKLVRQMNKQSADALLANKPIQTDLSDQTTPSQRRRRSTHPI